MDTTLIPRQSLTGYQAGRRLTRLLSSTPAFGSPTRRTWRCPHVMARPAPGRNQRAAKTTRTPNCGRTRDAQNRTICALAPPQPVSPPTAPNRSVSVPVLRAGGIATLAGVQFGQVPGGDPVLQDGLATDLMNLVAIQEVGRHNVTVSTMAFTRS